MQLLSIEDLPFHRLPYSAAGDNQKMVRKDFPFVRAKANRLPDGLNALFICSDLQGVLDSRIDGRQTPEQLGVAVAQELRLLSECEEVPKADRIGIVLCGDFYTTPSLEKRGGSGDARPVWNEFAKNFAWVVGVAGNHDSFEATASGNPQATISGH